MISSEKQAVLISCFDHYGHRMFVLDECLQKLGYHTTYITSDFDHTSKSVYTCKVPAAVQLPAMPYHKNLSWQRIVSHRNFARDVFLYLDSMKTEPAVVALLLPPNFLCHYAAKYKKKHPNVKLIFDVFDLWPETFPSGTARKLLAPVFSVWAWIRDHSLSAADHIITECELFQRRLGLDNEHSTVLYLCGNPLQNDLINPQLQEDRLELCYLGSINNVIGIEDICALIAQLAAKRPVVLHIIGKGEREQEFVEAAESAGAEVIFYGAIYDDAEKQQIMNRCHFGLNIMNSSVCVGLTMKSLEYFRHGLPIINSIPADTKQLVEQEHIGYQLDDRCADKVLSAGVLDCLKMRENVKHTFLKYFSHFVIQQQCMDMLKDLID